MYSFVEYACMQITKEGQIMSNSVFQSVILQLKDIPEVALWQSITMV